MEEIIDGVYHIVEKIGQGGSGSVYKAYHERLEKYVVVKRISTNYLSDSVARNEVDVLKGLKHTYLPQVIDFIKKDNEAYTVMDFIDGDDLFTVRKSKRIKTSDIIKYSVQLCEAVKYLHSQNPPIIHSDIKPGNIMITENDDICLIDFNISLMFNGNLKAVGATPGYASPEQVNADRCNDDKKQVKIESTESTTTMLIDDQTVLCDANDCKTELLGDDATELSSASSNKKIDVSISKKIMGIDERSDIYSVGAVIYFMITGEKPSSDFNNIKPLRSLKNKIPEGLIIIAEKAMSFNRKNRYQKIDDMLKALNSIMKLDKRYKALRIQRIIVSVICFMGMFVSAVSASYGYELLMAEKNEKYMGYINNADAAIQSGDFEIAKDYIAKAKSYIPKNPEAYYEEIFMAFKSGNYQECVNLWHDYSSELEMQNFALKCNLYFVVGNVYFELENYDNAILNYNKALSIEPQYKDCYRDLAIAYARNGKIDDASDILEKAENIGVSNEQIFLMKGEIEAYKENYSVALDYIEKSISITQDEYLLLRGITVHNRITADNTGDLNRSVKIINDNLKKFSSSYKDYAVEILGNLYKQLGDKTRNEEYYIEAVKQYKSITSNYSQNYVVCKNCFELQYHIGDYEYALKTLSEMEKNYVEDYWIMMNYAFTHIKLQESIENKNRSYAEAYTYYKKAEEYYKIYSRNGKTDPNMELLSAYINQLIDGGWIEE